MTKPDVAHLETIILDYLRKNHSTVGDIKSAKVSHMEPLDNMWKILGYYSYIDPISELANLWKTRDDEKEESDGFRSDNFTIIYNPELDSIVNFVRSVPKEYSLNEDEKHRPDPKSKK